MDALAQSPADKTEWSDAPFIIASELLADLVEPPDPCCPDKAMVFLSQAAMVEAATAPKGATMETRSLSEERVFLVRLM